MPWSVIQRRADELMQRLDQKETALITRVFDRLLITFWPALLSIIKYLRQYAHSHWSIGVFR